MNRAIFLDRDGTINVDTEYLYEMEKLKFISHALDAIKELSKTDYKIIITTGQSGIGRGRYSEDDYHNLMRFMIGIIEQNKGRIYAHYLFPHHPTEAIGEYKINCGCRKPKIGMLEQAVNDFGVDLKGSWIIGDKTDDIKCGENAGCRTILVETGKA